MYDRNVVPASFPAGEELTDDYALHDDCPWFEEVCAEHHAISCTSLGKEHR